MDEGRSRERSYFHNDVFSAVHHRKEPSVGKTAVERATTELRMGCTEGKTAERLTFREVAGENEYRSQPPSPAGKPGKTCASTFHQSIATSRVVVPGPPWLYLRANFRNTHKHVHMCYLHIPSPVPSSVRSFQPRWLQQNVSCS